MRIYLASSWRNPKQPEILAALREAGHEVYDFRNPASGNTGFGWKQTGNSEYVSGQPVKPRTMMEMLEHPVARAGFALDMGALMGADATVLALPCGKSAHLELGYAVGAGQRTYVLTGNEPLEPELMYRMCTWICFDVEELLGELDSAQAELAARRARLTRPT